MISPTGPLSPAALERRLRCDQIAILFTPSRTTRYGPFAALGALLIFNWGTLPLWMALLPIVLHVAATLLYEQQRAQFRATPPPIDYEVWGMSAIGQATIAGLTWTTSTLVWFNPNSVVSQTFLALVLVGIATASMVARASYLPAFLAHVCFVVFPIVILFAAQGTLLGWLTAMLGLVFVFFLFGWARRINDIQSEAIRLSIVNSSLIEELRRASHDAESARRAAEKSRDAAEAGNRAKTEFLATISHEIRTPLNGVLGMADVLLASDLTPTQKDAAETIRESAEALCTILNDVLEVSKLESGRFHLDPQPFDPRAIVQGVLRILQSRAWEKSLALSVSVDEDVPDSLTADPGRLRQILINLVGNALKFTDAGGVTVKIARDGTNAHMLRFEITDTGIGIPRDATAKLFKPFSQVDQSYSRRFGGAGLGLAICKRLVELMNGEIGVSSDVGSGSTFWFTIPIDASQAAPLPTVDPNEASEAAEPLLAPLNILVVEDNAISRRITETILVAAGNSVVFATNGLEALQALSTTPFDCILLDMVLPEMSGPDVVRMIRAQPGVNGRIPIVVVTGHDPAMLVQTHIANLIDGHVQKPVAPNDLLRAIAEAVAPEPIELDVPDAADGLIDIAQLDTLGDSLGEPMLLDVLKSYLTTLDERLSQVQSAVETGDGPLAARSAQDLIGASGDLGLIGLSHAARAVTQAARLNEGESEIAEAAAVLHATAARTREMLLERFPQAEAQAA
ncbi:MAG: response regulator [Alphaproteobacteria bacterium]|nr:response regulator [Alphaproteobacteria bacterium]